jgi:glyoxylase-like metal-dependent hydrolase (beta-lactamase superfamily II)
VEVRPIAQGLWRWTAAHPDWTPRQGGRSGWEAEVASVYLAAEDAVVLIDPFVPGSPEARERFWRALDRDLERLAGRPLAVLLSCAWHRRSAAEIAARYASRAGTRVLAHAESVAFLAELDPVGVRERETLPGGVEGRLARGPEPVELLYWIPAHATLVVADALIGAGAGRLRLCPPSWLGGAEEGRERLRSQLRPRLAELLELPVQRVLPAHGAPVLERGRDALAEALDAPPWGE